MYASYKATKAAIGQTSDEAMRQYSVVFVLGGPGAGKGTQCQKIVETFGYAHLSAGDLLREERKRADSQFGEEIEGHITNGTIVPVEITVALLKRRMGQLFDSEAVDRFLIDGFPRNEDNLQGWIRSMDDDVDISVNLQRVLFFNCSDQVCIDRCLSRGAAGSGRSDDNMESLKKRLVTYHSSTQPIIEHYNKQNLVSEIDASNTADEVFAVVREVFDSLKKFNVVFVLGGPGAGKGTQCARIVETYGYVHLSAGDLLREERKRPGSEFGEEIEGHITNGSIVPIAITIALLKRRMCEILESKSNKKFLIDGFPRNQDNNNGWITEMQREANLQRVLYFHCDDEVCIERCLSRGAAGSGRSDDNIESLKKRLVTYHSSTQPIIEHYNEQNLVTKLDASKSPDDVFADVQTVFDVFNKS